MARRKADIVGLAMAAAVMAFVILRIGPDPEGVREGASPRAAATPTTSREGLSRTIREMETRLVAGGDREAALLLADALMRQARVTGRAALTARAVEVIEPVARRASDDYEARRLLATAYAADHRFPDALRVASLARDRQPGDPWNYGIIGDAHLELGEYDQAFAAFERMVALKPSAASYSRLSYGFELQGRLEDAIHAMTLAVDAADPRDPEAAAWLRAQLGELYVQVGQLTQARRQFAWGERLFPAHPFIRSAIARLLEAEGDLEAARRLYEEEFAKLGTPDLAVSIGDLHEHLGDAAAAERFYAAAEAKWRDAGASEQDHFARFLADHDRRIEEAVQLAEAGAADAVDIVAKDALGWAYFKARRLQDADRELRLALRTGTRSAAIVYHAAAVRFALDDAAGARELLARLPGGPLAPARLAASVAALRERLERGAGFSH